MGQALLYPRSLLGQAPLLRKKASPWVSRGLALLYPRSLLGQALLLRKKASPLDIAGTGSYLVAQRIKSACPLTIPTRFANNAQPDAHDKHQTA